MGDKNWTGFHGHLILQFFFALFLETICFFLVLHVIKAAAAAIECDGLFGRWIGWFLVVVVDMTVSFERGAQPVKNNTCVYIFFLMMALIK